MHGLRSVFVRRRTLSMLLMIVGVVLLVYVFGEYWGMYRTQQSLESQWEQQDHAAQTRAPEAPHLTANDPLTRVVIPKINLDAIVVEGASRKKLAQGPGHVTDTAIPGEPGNAVITGHRDTFFRHIYELSKGDDILVRRNGQIFKYQVTGKKIVMPEDISVLKATPDAELTLITCYPIYYIGPAPKRLVVFSKLVGSGSGVPNQPLAHGAGQ